MAPVDGGVPDTGVADSGVADSGAPDAGSMLCADGNDTTAEAGELTLGALAGPADSIPCPGDKDYYAFNGTAGDWLRIKVNATAPAPDGRYLDPVLTLLDAAGMPVAENDDGRVGEGRISADSLIVTRLPATGRYFVRVMEYGDFAEGMAPQGYPEWTYVLEAVRFTADLVDIALDDETGDDAPSAKSMHFVTTGGADASTGFIAGTFRDASDVDVFSFEMTGTSPRMPFAAAIHAHGATASGSTSSCGDVWVTDAAGTDVIARIDNRDASGLWRPLPTLAPGSYLLWIEHPGGAVGANDFYVAAVTRMPTDNPLEANDAGNGTLAGAEPMVFEMGMGSRSALFLSLLPEATDVDYWAFDVATGETVTGVGCNGAWDGSGVRGLTAELRNSADVVITLQNEQARLPSPIFFDAAATGISMPGRYYLRLSKTGQDPEVSGNWARCGVAIRTAP